MIIMTDKERTGLLASMKRSLVIGVTGGVGAGKSTVLRYLQEKWQADILVLDDVSREMLEIGGLCYDETIALFGRDVVLPDGRLDRGKIARIVFSDEEKKKALNGLIHPAVRRTSDAFGSEARSRGRGVYVIEAALLIEEHYDEICDELWYIYAGEDVRAKRLAESRGYDAERIRHMMANQLSPEQFLAGCSVRIDNGGEPETAYREIDARLAELLGVAEGGSSCR